MGAVMLTEILELKRQGLNYRQIGKRSA